MKRPKGYRKAFNPNVGPRCSFCGAGQQTPPITLVNRPGWPVGTMICVECLGENYPNERPTEPSHP